MQMVCGLHHIIIMLYVHLDIDPSSHIKSHFKWHSFVREYSLLIYHAIYIKMINIRCVNVIRFMGFVAIFFFFFFASSTKLHRR